MMQCNWSILSDYQILNLINTGQTYRAWLSSQRDSLALALRSQASRNRRAGLGNVPTDAAFELRRVAREQPDAAIVSVHALYAYASLAGVRLAQCPFDVGTPVAVVRGQASFSTVCVDQFGFAALVRVLSPSAFLGRSDAVGKGLVMSMVDSGRLPLDLVSWVEA